MASTHKTCPGCGAMRRARRASASIVVMASDAHRPCPRHSRPAHGACRGSDCARVIPVPPGAVDRGREDATRGGSAAHLHGPAAVRPGAVGARAHAAQRGRPRSTPSTGPMREMVGHALRCEKLRAAVFAGKRSPMVFGQPDEWLALLIESMLQAGQRRRCAVAQPAAQAFDAAPATRGRIDGQPFEWIADADSRLGPVLEAMVNGRYYWMPFSRLARDRVRASDGPARPRLDGRDAVVRQRRRDGCDGADPLPRHEASEDGTLLMAARPSGASSAPSASRSRPARARHRPGRARHAAQCATDRARSESLPSQ